MSTGKATRCLSSRPLLARCTGHSRESWNGIPWSISGTAKYHAACRAVSALCERRQISARPPRASKLSLIAEPAFASLQTGCRLSKDAPIKPSRENLCVLLQPEREKAPEMNFTGSAPPDQSNVPARPHRTVHILGGEQKKPDMALDTYIPFGEMFLDSGDVV